MKPTTPGPYALCRSGRRPRPDLKDPRLIWLRAALFLVAGLASVAAILLERRSFRVGFLLAVVIWSFCRLYHFCFHVIERYLDPRFRFAGLGDVVRYVLTRQ